VHDVSAIERLVRLVRCRSMPRCDRAGDTAVEIVS
jgi:hypothetical protein